MTLDNMISTKTLQQYGNMVIILGTVCEEYFHNKYKNQDDFFFAGWDFDIANADNIILTFFHGDSADNEIECREMVSILTLMDFIKNR
jgi:hypothetical protein